MSISAHQKIKYPGFPTPRIGKGKVWVFLMVLLFSSFGVVGQNNTPPVYTHINSVDLPDFTIGALNTDDITVAIATDPDGNVYTLSFGKGVSKRNAEGVVVVPNFIPASALSSPLDIAIDGEGFVYVADYSETSCDQNGKIKVFDPNGVQVNTIYTQFYRPIGIDISNNNKLYVAEYNAGGPGCENDELSRISIYDPTTPGGARIRSTNDVNRPFRIAVNSRGVAYVSQAGNNNNGSVRIYNENLVYQSSLSNIISPGSVVIDNFDYIHVIEYAGRIDFRQFLNFEELTNDINAVFEISKQIYLGQEANDFVIKYYSPNGGYIDVIKDEIEFPVDIALNSCDRMYVNNAQIKGIPFYNPLNGRLISFIPTSLEFDLEIYKRTPSFDQEKPLITCPASIENTAPPGQNYAVVDFANPTVTDNCTFTVSQTQGGTSGSQFTVGEHTIEFTATDSSGNKDTCSFTITVNPAEEEPDTENPIISCPQNITRNVDVGTCGAVVTYAPPTATDNSGSATVTLKSGIASGGTFPVGTTTVTYEAVDDAGNKKECSFIVSVKDNEKPFLTCPADITKEIPADQNSVIVEYNKPIPSDNCSGTTVTQTKGQASGSQFPVGENEIEFTAKDAAGNQFVCSFTITVKKEVVDNPPVFQNCPTTIISKNNDLGKCGAIVTLTTPTATDDNGTPTVTRKDNGPLSGELFPVGTHVIIFEATDGVNDPVECSFEVIVSDNEKPEITCPADITKEIPADQNSVIVEFNKPVPSDNCSGVIVTQTEGQTSGSQFTVGEHEIEFNAKDAAGNQFVCSFTITVKREEVDNPPVFQNCLTTTISKNNDLGKCGAIVSFPTPTAIDDKGTPTVTRKDTGPRSGELFPVGTHVIVFEASDGVNVPVKCSFEVVITDNEKPIVTCPADMTKEIPADQNSVIVEYNKPVPSDNCSGAIVTQTNGQPSGSQFSIGEHEIEFTAKDAAGNQFVCSFTITVKKEEEEAPPVFNNCPSAIVRDNKPGECGAIVNFEVPTATDSRGNIEVTQISGPSSGSFFQVGASTLIFEAKGSDGTTVQCKFDVVVKDVEKPEFVNPCEGINYSANFEAGASFTVPNFYEQFRGTDNCDSEVSYLQDPAPGTVISQEGNYPVELTIKDDFGNINTCSFTLTLTTSDILSLSCSYFYILQPGENCQYTLPDLTDDYVVSPSGAVVTQSIPQGQILTQDTEVALTATYGDQTLTCKIKIKLVDYTLPEIECPPTQEVPFTASQGFVLPDYILQSQYSDNCEIKNVIQTPPAGTLIQEDQFVKLTVTDKFNNYKDCFVYVKFTEVENPLEISCPVDQSIPLNSGCLAEVPDFTAHAEVNDPNAIVTQSPSAGALIEDETEIILTATLGEKTVSCSFKLTPEDTIDPIVNCLPNQIENYDPATGFEVPDYTGLIEASDNCGISEIIQTPSEGTLIFEDTEINFIVKDAAGNSADCKFLLELTEDQILEISCPENQVGELNENCQFQVPDYGDLAEVNFEGAFITQVPAAGTIINSGTSVVLTATFADQTDICSFNLELLDPIAPVAKCILTGSYRLDENGSLTLDPAQIDNGSLDNCGIASMELDRDTFTTADIGDHTITLTVTDAAGNTNSCETTISILPYVGMGNDFACKTSVVLELDENGNAGLTPQDLYTGDPQERILAISKSNFNCSDVGENYINFTYQGNIDSGTCEIKVEVEDNLAPVVQTNNVTISLDDAGRAEISPALINNGTTDNCGTVNFTLDKSRFSCKDLGENLVNLTATDRNGNSTTATATVTVMGSCDTEPTPGGNGPDEIFIYPNPSPGPFTIATPVGVKIFRVEVFDFRGRFLFSKEFAENITTYTMDIWGVEQAVYVLKIYSSDGNKIRRLIKY